jgi:competence protein ComEC
MSVPSRIPRVMPEPPPVWLPARPWPVPVALGLACGIAARADGLAPWLLLALLPLARLARPLLLRSVRPATTPSPTMPARAWLALLLPFAAVLVGYVRFAQWQATPDPLAGLRDQELRLIGTSDGRLLAISEPRQARVAISPTGALPSGRVELIGTLRHADGKRNPGGFDYRAHLLRRGVHGQVLVAELLSFEPRSGLRDRLRTGVTGGLEPQEAALLGAMTLGVRDELGDLRDVFAAAGLAHVLALSGLHVGLLVAAAGRLLAPLGTLRYPALLVLDLGYMLLVGATPSVVRAAVMVAVVLFALWLGAGRIEPWPALGTAASLTLIARPAWLFDTSLQLSYGAVAGMLLFALPLATHLRGHPPRPWWHPRVAVGAALVTSAAAQSLTLPLVASSFGSVPLLSPLVNVIALPLASLLVPLGFMAGLLGLLDPGVAALVNSVTGPLAGALIGLAELGARLPQLVWGEVDLPGFVLFALAMTALALAANRVLKPRRALSVALIAALLSAVAPPAHPVPELIAFDVGQGDSLLIRLPGRVEILVDGGGTPFSSYDVGAGIVVPALRALGVDELELVVATHADADHMEGLASVLGAVPVQLLLIGAESPTARVFTDLMSAARERGVPVRPLLRGERLRLAGSTLEVLNPPARSYGSSNDDSVALVVHIAGAPRVLLLGDVSRQVERDLTPPEVDVLVVPHHGSPSSSSHRLLAAARPRHAVISVGRNRYGHPSAEVLERLGAVAATVHTTLEAGAVRLPLGPKAAARPAGGATCDSAQPPFASRRHPAPPVRPILAAARSARQGGLC